MSSILARIHDDIADVLGPAKDFAENVDYYRTFERDRIYRHKMNRKRKSNGNGKSTGRAQSRHKRARTRAEKHTPIMHGIGHPPGTGSTAKSRLIENDGTPEALESRSLQIVDLTNIPHGGDNSINTRQRDSIYVGGFHVKMEISNEQTTPTYFSYAVISPRSSNVVTSLQFFRYFDDFRSVNFSDALTSLEFASLPINSDKYHVHMHRTFSLAPLPAATGHDTNTMNSYRTVDVYVPFKRQLKYSGGTSDISPESGATYLVYWCDTWGRDSQASGQSGTVSLKKQCITYFREVGERLFYN